MVHPLKRQQGARDMLHQGPKVQEAFDRNRRAFHDELERLLVAFEGKYALVHDAKVVGTFDSMRNAHVHGRRHFGLDSIYIGHVVRIPDVVHMPNLPYGLLHGHL
jgi:hypothetical protein